MLPPTEGTPCWFPNCSTSALGCSQGGVLLHLCLWTWGQSGCASVSPALNRGRCCFCDSIPHIQQRGKREEGEESCGKQNRAGQRAGQAGTQAGWQGVPLSPGLPPIPLGCLPHFLQGNSWPRPGSTGGGWQGSQQPLGTQSRGELKDGALGGRDNVRCFYQLIFKSRAALTSDPGFASFHLPVLQNLSISFFFSPFAEMGENKKKQNTKQTKQTNNPQKTPQIQPMSNPTAPGWAELCSPHFGECVGGRMVVLGCSVGAPCCPSVPGGSSKSFCAYHNNSVCVRAFFTHQNNNN